MKSFSIVVIFTGLMGTAVAQAQGGQPAFALSAPVSNNHNPESQSPERLRAKPEGMRAFLKYFLISSGIRKYSSLVMGFKVSSLTMNTQSG